MNTRQVRSQDSIEPLTVKLDGPERIDTRSDGASPSEDVFSWKNHATSSFYKAASFTTKSLPFLD